ncbi:hypothetical protein AB5I41_21010 [Sphingomonas sp. MMS24-JH45]
MKHDPIVSGKRKSVDLSIDTGIVAAARAAVNLCAGERGGDATGHEGRAGSPMEGRKS